MLHKDTLSFLKTLSKNNNRAWFAENKKTYDEISASFNTFINELLLKTAQFDDAAVGLTHKDCVFRIYRDVRFSKNKDPYKNAISASINKGGKKQPTAGYYLHIEPGGSMIAGGMYMPETELLGKIRQEIAYNTIQFKKILNSKSFKQTFGGLSDEGKLKTSPKGYDANHPEIELLKNKSFIVVHPFKDNEVMSEKFMADCLKVFKELKPFDDFLNAVFD